MTHSDAGHYALKHPPGTDINQQIADHIKNRATDGKISCAVAHAIAGVCGVEPDDVGVTIDLMEIRISGCQLGLFGYGATRKITEQTEPVLPELEAAIKKYLVQGKLTCLAAWNIADALGIPRMKVSAACDTLQIKISTCQLGSF
jgi:hypothetical protein